MKGLRIALGFCLLAAIVGAGIRRYDTLKNSGSQPHRAQPIRSDTPLPPEPSTFPVTVTDDSGTGVPLAAAPRRIVSLAPGATELLFDLHLQDRIAADTTACDWPQEAKLLPHIGGWSDMSLESIVAKNPDLIIADGSINGRIIPILRGAGLPVFVMHPRTLDQAYSTIRALGRVTGETVIAETVVDDMIRRVKPDPPAGAMQNIQVLELTWGQYERRQDTLAVAEHWFGKGRGTESFAVVTMGAGVGCGLVLRGRLYTGVSGLAGELGHLPLQPDGPECTCGNRGCLEAVASDQAILHYLQDHGVRDCRSVQQAERLAQDEETAAGAAAREAFAVMGRALGRGLAALCNLLNLDRVILSGEGVVTYDLFRSELKSSWRGSRRRSVSSIHDGTPWCSRRR